MKKNGFSLAEVLITLAIVGFIAAVTLPSLQINVEKQKVGPAIMKAVNTLEVANSVALQVTEATNLVEATEQLGYDKGEYLSGVLKDYTKLTKVEYSPSSGPMKSVGSNAFATKDGIVFKNAGLTEGGGKVDVKTTGDYYKVYVDVNGSKSPNVEGRDIFQLYVDTKGMVIPYGSTLDDGYAQWTQWTTGCPSVSGKTKTTPSDPASCAGSIVDNGGRVLYFYEAVK